MPQIQIIPANPTFGTLLAQHLGKAVGDIGQGYFEGQQNRQKRLGTQTLLQQYGITPEQAEVIAKSGLQPKDILAHGDKLRPKAQAGQQGLQDVFNEMSSLVAQNAPGIGISPGTFLGLNRKGVENRAYFDTMRAKFEAALLPLVNKGSLAKERFNYIMSNIPQGSDSQRVIAGKLKALAKDLDLDASALADIPFLHEDQSQMSANKIGRSYFAKPSKGHVLMQAPDGKFVEVPQNEVKKAEQAGGKIVR